MPEYKISSLTSLDHISSIHEPMNDIIKPRILRGFSDSLPEAELAKKNIRTALETVFKSFGFVPIDTPALEYAEILLGKGGGETDKQVYRFLDHGNRDVAMRFDLTVPFARFMAGHIHELPLPFKRYHIAKVWRGENTQRGRYREFIQIDFDIVGTDSVSADMEILLVMQKSFSALVINDFRIHFFHRELLNQYMEAIGLDLETFSAPILRSIDKIRKIGIDKTNELLTEICGSSKAQNILNFIQAEKTNTKTLKKICSLLPEKRDAYTRIETILNCLEELEISEYFLFDPSITRGLDYYTGIVYETFLTGLPEIGSVCSGGRYNNLASLYTKEKIPGVGSSIGLDRLLSAMNELKILKSPVCGVDLIILYLDDTLLSTYHKLAEHFRETGYSVEVFPLKKKLAAQFTYAEKRGIPYALLLGEREYSSGTYNLKDLTIRKSYENLKLQDLEEKLAELHHSSDL